MNTKELELLYAQSFHNNLALADLIEKLEPGVPTPAILFGKESARFNRHKKAISLPGAGWVNLSESQLATVDASEYEWLAFYDSTATKEWKLVVGRGNPFKDAQEPPMPRRDGEVIAIPFSLAKIVK